LLLDFRSTLWVSIEFFRADLTSSENRFFSYTIRKSDVKRKVKNSNGNHPAEQAKGLAETLTG
jgi:hypothetical protein